MYARNKLFAYMLAFPYHTHTYGFHLPVLFKKRWLTSGYDKTNLPKMPCSGTKQNHVITNKTFARNHSMPVHTYTH